MLRLFFFLFSHECRFRSQSRTWYTAENGYMEIILTTSEWNQASGENVDGKNNTAEVKD